MTTEQAELCTLIRNTVKAHHGATLTEDARYPDFATPEQWRARGELYGHNAVLIVVHDGGPLAPFFSFDYEDYDAIDAMNEALRVGDYWAEQCTTWYSAIYRA